MPFENITRPKYPPVYMGKIGFFLCQLLDGLPEGPEGEQVPHAGPNGAHTGTCRGRPDYLSGAQY